MVNSWVNISSVSAAETRASVSLSGQDSNTLSIISLVTLDAIYIIDVPVKI